MINVAILGSTGSIGSSTLDVIARQSEQFNVFALTANKNVDRLYEQCLKFLPEIAVMVDENSAVELQQRLKNSEPGIKVMSGRQALDDVAAAEQVDYVMAAIVGAAGLSSSLAAAYSGKRILLANKESLVMSGALFMQAVKENGAQLLPIDSEHNAIFQSMPEKLNQISANTDNSSTHNLQQAGVEKILLTASGGPFLNKTLDELHSVTPEQACAHPNWDMGRKISVDSATMMNKGLEVIEASWLFNASADDIQVVIHPESVIHSMVSYNDGSVLAQLGNPDMRTPIAHAMAWPERMSSGVAPLDIFKVAQLNFQTPDYERFVCLKLAYDALRTGGTAPAILNAANEIAVEAFLQEQISFTQIAKVVQQTMTQLDAQPADSMDVILAADAHARSYAQTLCQQAV